MKISFVILIFFILGLSLFINKQTFTNIKKAPKILHLVLFSHDNGAYDMMYQLTRKFYKSFPNVTTYYYCFNPNIKDVSVHDDILYIKGDEGYIPNILDKTIKAFEYFNTKIDYDYIVRSNISTVIDFNLLTEKIEKDKPSYGGPYSTLNWLDPNGGIVDKTYFGLKFVTGTSIILSKKLIKKILENKHKINYNIIDDVAIGLLIRDHIPTPITMYNNDFTEKYNENAIFYRNKNNFKINYICSKCFYNW